LGPCRRQVQCPARVGAALAAGPAAAQTAAEPEAALAAAVDQARAAVAASPSKSIPSCPDAQALETPFTLTLSFASGRRPLTLDFEYEGCEEFGRNDLLPPYTERSYKGADGYGLTIVTNRDEARSEVLVSKGRDWVGRFGTVANADLLSGDPLEAGDVDVADSAGVQKGKAALRDSAKPLRTPARSTTSASTTR